MAVPIKRVAVAVAGVMDEREVPVDVAVVLVERAPFDQLVFGVREANAIGQRFCLHRINEVLPGDQLDCDLVTASLEKNKNIVYLNFSI